MLIVIMTQRKKIDVILLCGGKGERLRPYTANLPKPLLKVNNKPFLYYIINKFLKINVNQIILASGYKSTKVSLFVNKYFKHNDKIKLVDSGNVDIIKRLQDSSKLIKNDFLVCYGDTYVNFNINKYINEFLNIKNNNSFVLGTYYKIKFGTLSFNKKNFLIKNFKEKPVFPEPINLGYFLFNKEVLSIILKYRKWIQFLKAIVKNKKLVLKITYKKHFSFDSPTEYHEIKTTFV